jgi:hypothetical protein
MAAQHRFDVIHLDLVGGFIIKHKLGFNEFKNTVGLCIFEHKKKTRIRSQILSRKINFIDHPN